MSTLGALSQAWTTAEAALPLGWLLAGVELLGRPDYVPGRGFVGRAQQWRSWALGTGPHDVVEAFGAHHYQALNNLADKLQELRGPTTG